MLECSVEDYFCNTVKVCGGRTYKLKFIGIVGAPDRLVVFKGLHLVELKRPKGGVLSPRQKRRHEEIRAAGAPVHVIWTIAEANAFFSRLR